MFIDLSLLLRFFPSSGARSSLLTKEGVEGGRSYKHLVPTHYRTERGSAGY
jgi:hypothetical protein